MELRRTEEKIDELTLVYNAIRQSPILNNEQVALLPPFPLKSTSITSTDGSSDPITGLTSMESIGTDNHNNDNGNNSTSVTTTSTGTETTITTSSSNPICPPSTLAGLVRSIQIIESSLIGLQPKVDKFRKKLTEIDPVTEKPRYGPKSYERVQRLVELYDFLCQHHLHPKEDLPSQEDADNSKGSVIGTDNNCSSGSSISISSVLLFRDIQKEHMKQLDDQRVEEALVEQQRREEEEEQRRRIEQAREEQHASERERAAQVAAEQAAEVERLHQQAEQVRRQRRSQWEAQQQSERDWVHSIVKGVEGVQLYIQELKNATADNKAAQSKALTSLFGIFDQIQRHPEEVNFRKIRLSHEGFQNDIGRYKGGIEILIAAGFRPTKLPTTSGDNVGSGSGSNNSASSNGNVDDDQGAVADVDVPTVPCLVSKEPNLETDMDGWSAWYDLNKATFEILQKEVLNLKK